MRLADWFKEAIESADWDAVCDVYETITGEKISPPTQTETITEERSLADIEMPDKRAGRQGKKKRIQEDSFIVTSKSNIKSGRKYTKTEPIGQRTKNLFIDDKTIASHELVTDKPHLGVKNPTPRGNRGISNEAEDTGKKMHVVCCLCNNEYEISPILAHGYSTIADENVWKCNDCCTKSGRTRLRREENEGTRRFSR